MRHAARVSGDDIEQHYLAAQRSFAALAREFSADDWATLVPCCPGWTVRDVLSHVAGIPDDVFAGRIDGVASRSGRTTALGRPGNRDSDIIVGAAGDVLAELRERGVELRGVTPFEVFRSKLGRRSRAQIEEYDWVGEPAALATALDAWFEFGPAPQPVLE